MCYELKLPFFYYATLMMDCISVILETLSNISRDAVGKLLKRVKKGFSKEDVGYLRHCEPVLPVISIIFLASTYSIIGCYALVIVRFLQFCNILSSICIRFV